MQEGDPDWVRWANLETALRCCNWIRSRSYDPALLAWACKMRWRLTLAMYKLNHANSKRQAKTV